ncbi:transcriptional activator NhaR [Thiothrix lacustris]|uniref:transcriptional activator NhaR n=1 Tax=Thiothrix lacustris TaxID=525917 RepID=UPI0027E3B7E9|nr:transcriptional activator NhaR [Thiothrix lacustris]WMP18022.1 transcriptional activator NhaR [Thiothrix lacustris]
MLNYKHLYYFREVATLGSIARACDSLNLTPQTISGQLQLLEESLGVKLLRKQGRNLELTEAGQVARRYADEIFQLGSSMEQALRSHPSQRARLFRVGVVDVVPKTIAYKLLEPAMELTPQIHIVCTEGPLSDLLGELAMHRIELVIADHPMPNNMPIKGFSHRLGSSCISFFAHTSVKEQLQGEFPLCLNDAPLLIPSEGTSVRNELEQWFHQQKLTPKIIGEFDDSALMRAFGLAGSGIFVAPSVQETTFTQEPNMHCIGQASDVVEQFFAISVERRISHPAVLAITKHAQDWLQTKL